MEILIIVAIIFLTVLGLLGCVLPALPGPPLNYGAMLLMQWQYHCFGNAFLIVMGVLTALVLVLDFAIPVFGAKVFSATKQGIRGSILGMIAGMFFSPVGMMGGILLGAILGDMAAGRNVKQAITSGAGTFIGTLAGMAIKILLSTVIAMAVFFQFVKMIIAQWN